MASIPPPYRDKVVELPEPKGPGSFTSLSSPRDGLLTQTWAFWFALLDGFLTQIDTGASTSGATHLWLGGSRETAVTVAVVPAWTPVLSWVPFYCKATKTLAVSVESWAVTGGVGATVRLYNVTDSTVAHTFTTAVSTSPVAETANVLVTSGKTYRLEVLSDTSSENVFALGQIGPTG